MNRLTQIGLLLILGLQVIAQEISPGILLTSIGVAASNEEKAINYYSEAIERNPRDVQALILRSELYRSLGRTQSANEDLRRAMSINPYARIYTNKDFRQSLFANKKYNYIREPYDYNNADFEKTYLLKDQYQSFMKEDTALSFQEMTLNLAIESLINQDFDDTKAFLKQLDLESKASAIYYDMQGVVHLENKNYYKALEQFNKSIELNPDFVISYHNRAITYKKLGEFDKAELDFYRALELNDSIEQIYFGKAKLMELKGDIRSAKQYYKDASRNTYYPEASVNYAVLLKSSGEYTKAMIEIDQLIEDDPYDSRNYYVRGGLHFIYGEYEKATEDFNTYLRIHSDDKEALFFRGVSRILMNEKDDGCEDLKRSIDLGYDKSNTDMILFMCD